MKRGEIRVSDHCLLRYFERVLKYDTEAIRNAIAKDCKAAIRAGASSFVQNGFIYHFEGTAVKTVTFVKRDQHRRAEDPVE